MDKPLVAIRSLVYNHEPYLRDFFEGIVSQKTKFPFIAVVHDDCSTDGSAAIIREYADKYPEIIKPIYEEVNCYQNGMWPEANQKIFAAYGDAKYIAYCEGDDYWTDPLKLQKQVDILESNPDYSMCYTDYTNVNAAGELIVWSNREKNVNRSFTGDSFAELLKGNYIQTCTILYRKTITDDKEYQGRLDYELSLQCALKGKCVFIAEKMSNYRIQPTSIIHTQFAKIKAQSNEIWYRYVERYNSELESQRECIDHIKIMSTICYMLISKFLSAKYVGDKTENMQIKSLLKRYPTLYVYLPFGILKRIGNKVRKLIKNK